MTSKADAFREPESGANVFVSYSRKDASFVDRLEAALKARGFASKIDRSDIYAFEDWWRRIETLILKADTIVFVISPEAVSSNICRKEVAFAAELGKRFAPIVCRTVDTSAIPVELARLNFIFFNTDANFDESADKLAEALSTDIDWIRRHTEFGELARRWSQAGSPSPKGLLLRPPVLEEAERWIDSRPAEAPLPTKVTQAFIVESRRTEIARRKALFIGLGLGLVLVSLLGGSVIWQRGVALRNAEIAETRLLQQNRNLVSSYIAQSGSELAQDNLVAALEHAIAATKKETEYSGLNDRHESDDALRRILSKDRLLLHVRRGSDVPVWPFEFIDEKTLAYTTKHEGLFVVNLSERRVAWRLELPEMPNPKIMKMSQDGGSIFIASEHKVAIIDISRKRIQHILDFPLTIRALSVSEMRQELAVGCDQSISFFDLRDIELKPSFFALPMLSRGEENLTRMAYDRKGITLYVATRAPFGRSAHIASLQRQTNRLKLIKTNDAATLADEETELEAYRDADHTVIYWSHLQNKFGLFDESSGKLTDFRETLLSMQKTNGGPIY